MELAIIILLVILVVIILILGVQLSVVNRNTARMLREQLASQNIQLESRLRTLSTTNEQQLRRVYEGIGEMRVLAEGIGDLKKILGNVKTRGILGEVQLGAILAEILSPTQYDTNVPTKKGSRAVVEYAVKLPTQGDEYIYLPIDAKFPADAYSDLQDALNGGSPEAVQLATTTLSSRIKSFAKDISDKYLDPPNTTDFAIMFLPFEGLYAQVINSGLVEVLQRDYRVNIAGPSTMAALLNSLQMGFRAFALQTRSNEVWSVLGAVKTEFDRFAAVLSATQMRLGQAEQELDKLVGVRTRVI
ncbi:MAG: DNA recombination protein RmuC, partial [Angelakisella sp.]